ncbi:MAG: alpha/beta fold hydrolase [Candidatus Aenigmarchaeota archaeon]|nr:alpha/beta fold hydrolase [Candidatus Aenigmarchaeota archaeon]
MKRVFIIHGWGGSPGEGWLPWLKKELKKRKIKVLVPKMPNTNNPKIETWVPFLANLVGKSDRDTYFVGHSIGCQTVLRYLQTQEKTGGVVFVAGWFTLTLDADKEKEIAKPWLETPINFSKIRKTTKKFVAIFSDNDPYVPVENVDFFKKLGAKTIVENRKGHYTDEAGITKVPSALGALLKMME